MQSFDFKKLYAVGNFLKNQSKKEEYQRSSINRYYYSIYDPVKDYYEQSFRKVLPSKNGHSILIGQLEQSPFEKEQRLGILMRNLRNMRNQSDYHKNTVNINDAEKSKKIRDKIWSILEDLKNNPLRLSMK